MTKEFNLSECDSGYGADLKKTEDVKEFIKRENEIIIDFLMDKINSGEMQMRRKKLAGDELSK